MEGNNNNRPQAPRGARLAFGIFMILIYVGVGCLFIFDIFNFGHNVLNYVVGGLLVVYGFFRAYREYRLYKGV